MPPRNPRSTKSLKRKSLGYRNPRKSILIVVEGEETEYNYFEDLKKELKLLTVDIKVQSSKNSDPLGVVKYAYNLYNNRLKESKIGNKLPYERVFCVIDGDHPNINNYRDATKEAKRYKYELIVSRPCFELWFLLHFQYSSQTYQFCQEVIKNLNKHISNYDKADEIFKKISDKTETAINNAKHLEQFHIENGNIEDNLKNPSTQVYVLIETLNHEKNFD